MPGFVDEWAHLLRRLAPKNEYQVPTRIGKRLNDLCREGFPADACVTERTPFLHGKNRIKKEHALASPIDQAARGANWRTARLFPSKLLEDVQLFDVYKGKQIKEGYKSVAYNISFRAQDRTLTDEEVNAPMKKIIAELEAKLGAQLRDK